MSSSQAETKPAGRPRDPDLERSILTATQTLLIEKGYGGTTIAEVARAAGSGKAAIYRRWPGKIDLIVAAVRDLATPVDPPDTGSLRDDLLAAAMHYARADERSSRVLASLLSELGRDAELYEAARTAIGAPPADAIAAVIQRGIDRGALSPTAPVPLLASIIPSVAFGRVTLQRRALDRQTVTDLVDGVLMPALTAATDPSGRAPGTTG